MHQRKLEQLEERKIKFYDSITTKGYARKAMTICSFSSNMTRACYQTERDSESKKCVDEPAHKYDYRLTRFT